MTEITLQITPRAIEHIKSVMQRQDKHFGFRLTMKKYGCNGYGYVPDVIAEPVAGDIELNVTDEIRVFVDPKFADYLAETTVDYVTKSLGQNQLVFNNPNAEGECGCGESVNFKEK